MDSIEDGVPPKITEAVHERESINPSHFLKLANLYPIEEIDFMFFGP